MQEMRSVFEAAALEAGSAIMEIFRGGCAIGWKADRSPVTRADEEAERIILSHLSRAYPQIPVVAEEATAAGQVPEIGRAFFLVDPLDGTREFIEQRHEFTVNIAYIVDGVPVAGIVYAPALRLAFSAASGVAEKLVLSERAEILSRQPIRARLRPPEAVALASRCHDSPRTGTFLSDNAIAACTNIGSSLKFCLLAEGQADVYPRFTRTMEWDTAAGDAVLRAAGGRTLTLDGRPLAYGKRGQAGEPDFVNPDFISWGASAAASGMQTGESARKTG